MECLCAQILEIKQSTRQTDPALREETDTVLDSIITQGI